MGKLKRYIVCMHVFCGFVEFTYVAIIHCNFSWCYPYARTSSKPLKISDFNTRVVRNRKRIIIISSSFWLVCNTQSLSLLLLSLSGDLRPSDQGQETNDDQEMTPAEIADILEGVIISIESSEEMNEQENSQRSTTKPAMVRFIMLAFQVLFTTVSVFVMKA